ncbi:hypothetical protein FRB96_000933 [Tulasnella sp. 330]|nr:hypothetical protein FRB96_000933 [Tulasnella sp. 330]KAG8877198.1 hypothetical protein FRB98_006837 [Tulasnella sp. 332]
MGPASSPIVPGTGRRRAFESSASPQGPNTSSGGLKSSKSPPSSRSANNSSTTGLGDAHDRELRIRGSRSTVYHVGPPVGWDLRITTQLIPTGVLGNKFNSLTGFWSLNWHGMFRRLLDRVSAPTVQITQRVVGHRLGKPTLNFLRCLMVFGVSEGLHIGITFTIPLTPRTNRRIVKPGTLKFLLSQPFGLLFELMVVNLATERLPGGWKMFVRRAYPWLWVVWTSRWFSDGFTLLEQFTIKNIQC